MTLKPEKELYLLHSTRWISAAIVAVSHALDLVFNQVTTGHAAGPMASAITYGASLGHGAVILFFALSGYLVGGPALEDLQAFSVRSYAINRFSRIYIALLPALVLATGLDGLAYLLAPSNPVYTTAWCGSVNHSLFQSYTLPNVLATLLSLENVIGKPMGSNGPLWSLGYEWLFYILFPAAIFLARAVKIPGVFGPAFIGGVFALAMVAVGRKPMSVFWMIWLLNAYARVAANRRWIGANVARVGAVLALVGFLAPPIAVQRINDIVIGLGCGVFFSCSALLRTGLHHPTDQTLASFSYSMYIVHLPVMTFTMFVLISAGFTSIERLDFGFQGILICFVLLALPTAIAYFFGFVFERQTDRLRRFLTSKTTPVSAPA